VESIAISLLHSYTNPTHEVTVEKIAAEHYPEIMTSISSEVLPEIKEYERTMTTALNVYTKPLINRYLTRLEEKFSKAGFTGKLFLMLSSSGWRGEKTAHAQGHRPAAGWRCLCHGLLHGPPGL
jgi:N-methylhydantoinase A